MNDVIVVNDLKGAKWLADHIRSNVRLPLVVVTARGDDQRPPLDVDGLLRRLDGSADVVLLLGVDNSYAFRDAIGGPRFAVHSGFVRVYPVGTWNDGNQNRNLIAAHETKDANRVIRSIEEQVNRLYAFTPVETRSQSTTLVPATAEVVDTPVPGGSAVTVRLLDRGGPSSAFFSFKLLMAGLPPERLIKKGMKFTGKRDTSFIPTFYPDVPADDPRARLFDLVGEGRSMYAFVQTVTPECATLLLHPSIPVTIAGGGSRNLTFELSERECVSVFVMVDDASGEFVVDVATEGDDVHPGMSVFSGGPPWIVPARIEVPQTINHSDIDDTGDDHSQLAELRAEIDDQDREIARLKVEVRELRSRLRNVEGVHSVEEEFRRDLALSYFRRLSSSTDRAAFPLLEDFEVAPEFLPSVLNLVNSGGISWDRVIEVCAMVACHNSAAITTKPFINYANDVDHEGWKPFRANLQTGSRSARRLRYSLQGLKVRFEVASLHDDEL